ncbi:MAG: hypothetical protein LPD71_10125, partial [Shewanella sp.]|nr:hypothetical protein [Shewanella sp.]
DSKEKLFFVVFVVQSFSFKRNGNILSEQHCAIEAQIRLAINKNFRLARELNTDFCLINKLRCFLSRVEVNHKNRC